MNFGKEIHCTQRMNPNNLDDPPRFCLATPEGQNFHLFSKILLHLLDELAQIQLQTFMVPRGWNVKTLVDPQTFPLAPQAG